jgi:hypothetical protein
MTPIGEFSTVIEHVDAGRIVPRKRTTGDDLLMAATWCEQYEGEANDETLAALATAALFLRRQAARRKS